MDIARFRREFWSAFGAGRNRPELALEDRAQHLARDTCPDVPGMLSVKKQRLLHLAYSLLPENEAYLEVGTYMGKSLISAMLGNPRRAVYAADNFSEFDGNSFEVLQGNLERYGLREQVNFCNADFRRVFDHSVLKAPVGLYFYDGGHDYVDQYDAIRLVEPFLADEALILVDDWRFAPDSGSYARVATLRAAKELEGRMKLLYELPSRYNGDLAMWWNGLGVLSFEREARLRETA